MPLQECVDAFNPRCDVVAKMSMLVNPGLHELLLAQVKPRLLDVANLVNVLWHIASFKLVKLSVICFFVYGIDDCKPVPEEFRPFLNALLVTLAAHERRSAVGQYCLICVPET